MEIELQIDYIFEKVTRHSPHLIAQMLNKYGNFSLTRNLTLGGVEIEIFRMPRSLDEEGNLRFDIFTFVLKDKLALSHLKKGANSKTNSISYKEKKSAFK